MSHIISIHHLLLQFLVLIYIIPIYVKSQTPLKFLFLNGLNVIRCSDDTIQVYNFGVKDTGAIYDKLKCDKKKDVINTGYVGYKWSTLQIICSEEDNEMHEEQIIVQKFDGYDSIKEFPDVEEQLAEDIQSFQLTVVRIVSQINGEKVVAKISSSKQSTDGTDSQKTIYISFKAHPIICRLEYENNEELCSSGPKKEVKATYVCYYNPYDEKAPTIEEMTAELKQVEEAEKEEDKDAYVLNLQKPEIDAVVPSLNEDSDKNKTPSSNPNKPANTNGKHSVPHKPSKTKEKKQNVPKIIGLILGIIFLIALIGGIAFYMIRKNRLNNSLSSTTSIENGGNKGLSSLAPNQSNQSLSVASTDDTNTEISMKAPIKKEKPTIEVQPSERNKRHRAGTNMTFNEDMQ